VDKSRIAINARSALRKFYRNEGREFWRAFEKDPDDAVRTFAEEPTRFGAVQLLYDWMPMVMKRDHARVVSLLEKLLVRKRASAGDAVSEPGEGR
jgi:hypothetical protein